MRTPFFRHVYTMLTPIDLPPVYAKALINSEGGKLLYCGKNLLVLLHNFFHCYANSGKHNSRKKAYAG